MEIHRDRAKGVLTLTQSTYTHKMLDAYGFRNGALHKTPMDSRAVYTINTEGQADEATVKDYQAMIGSLLYLTVYSRPDILYAVVKLAVLHESEPDPPCCSQTHLSIPEIISGSSVPN